MRLHRRGTSSSVPPESGFVGAVRIEGYFRRPTPSRLAGATVSFGPGARTPWKVNELGQTIVVTHGSGWAGSEGQGVVELRAGDVVWFAPGEPHWEGATPSNTLTYVAVQEEIDTGVQFLSEVTDAEYAAAGELLSGDQGPQPGSVSPAAIRP